MCWWLIGSEYSEDDEPSSEDSIGDEWPSPPPISPPITNLSSTSLLILLTPKADKEGGVNKNEERLEGTGGTGILDDKGGKRKGEVCSRQTKQQAETVYDYVYIAVCVIYNKLTTVGKVETNAEGVVWDRLNLFFPRFLKVPSKPVLDGAPGPNPRSGPRPNIPQLQARKLSRWVSL